LRAKTICCFSEVKKESDLSHKINLSFEFIAHLVQLKQAYSSNLFGDNSIFTALYL
jgi:hypothetical protein